MILDKLIVQMQDYLAPEGQPRDLRIAIVATVVAWFITLMLRISLQM